MLRDGYISHIVSQNCDALHLRSGIPQNLISEIHGNSFIEWCKTCHKQFIRDFDVTHDSDRETHVTKRKCEQCENPLVDTIIYCNESRWLPFPQNWIKVEEIKKNIDLIIVLGTSCKVLA
uniref:Deacetylase sirtuin-type domain-containing protein n=1 Tax=Panagrolaimus sp. PS1159 TaxID=55785 RepID=A0AC35GW69_9BILA